MKTNDSKLCDDFKAYRLSIDGKFDHLTAHPTSSDGDGTINSHLNSIDKLIIKSLGNQLR